MDCQLSGTATLQVSRVISTGSTGDAITVLFSPQTPYQVLNWATNSTVGGTLTYGSWQSVDGYAALNGATQAVRVVSAIMEVEYVGTTAQDSGIIVCGQQLGVHDIKPTDASGYGAFNSVGNFRTFPYRQGARVLYRPIDNTDLEYSDTDHTQDAYNTYIGHYPQSLTVQITGAASNVASCKVFCKVNYEVLPTTLNPLIDTFPSPSSSSMMDEALNALGSTPLTSAFLESGRDYLNRVVGTPWMGYRGGIQPGTVLRGNPLGGINV